MFELWMVELGNRYEYNDKKYMGERKIYTKMHRMFVF